MITTSQDKKQKQTQTQSIEPQLQPAYGQLAGGITQNISEGYKPFPGTRVAPFSDIQTKALDISGFLDSMQPLRDSPIYGAGNKALENVISGEGYSQPITPEQATGMFEQIYGAPARKDYAENVAPAIKEAFAGPGYQSSARRRAQMEGAQDLQDWLGTKRGEFDRYGREYNAQLDRDRANRVLGGVAATPSFLSAPAQVDREALAGRAGVFDFASAEQQQRQNVIGSEMQKWAEQYNITDPLTLNTLMQLLGMKYGTTTGNVTNRASDYDEFMGYAQPIGRFVSGIPGV